MTDELAKAEEELRKALAKPEDNSLEDKKEDDVKDEPDDQDDDASPDTAEDYTDDEDYTEDEESDDEDEKRDEQLEQRREKRRRQKELRRNKERELKLKYAQEKQEKEEILSRLQAMENRQIQGSMSALEEDIRKGLKAIDIAKQAMVKAEKEGNGVQYAKAVKVMYDAEEFVAQRNELREEVVRSIQNKANGGAMTTNPVVNKYANTWLNRNKDWFSQENVSLKTAVLAIDHQVLQEGFNPQTAAYWKELESRCRTVFGKTKAAPKRTRGPGASSSGDSMKDDVGGLDRQFVSLLKSQGLWDDPKLRKTAIDDYKQRKNQK